MSRRYTVALRVCLRCQETFGVDLWPWNGARWTRTHGLCRACHAQLEAEFDAAPARTQALPPAA